MFHSVILCRAWLCYGKSSVCLSVTVFLVNLKKLGFYGILSMQIAAMSFLKIRNYNRIILGFVLTGRNLQKSTNCSKGIIPKFQVELDEVDNIDRIARFPYGYICFPKPKLFGSKRT